MACALSYTRAQAPATPAPAPEYPIRDARELFAAIRLERVDAQNAAKRVIAQADPVMVADLLRFARGGASRREKAQKVLGLMGRKAVPVLFDALGDEAAAVTAGGALVQILDARDQDRIPALVDCVQNKPLADHYCATALVKVASPKAAAHVPALAACVEKGSETARAYCATALGRVGRAAAPAAPALRKALKDPSSAVRTQAKTALRRVGA